MKKRIIVRGGINSMDVDETLTLVRGCYMPSTIRSAASSIKTDTGKTFTVYVTGDTIVISQKS